VILVEPQVDMVLDAVIDFLAQRVVRYKLV